MVITTRSVAVVVDILPICRYCVGIIDDRILVVVNFVVVNVFGGVVACAAMFYCNY
jgi:hypothetical protein